MLRTLAIIFMIIGLLTACGQTGKLFLPDDESPNLGGNIGAE